MKLNGSFALIIGIALLFTILLSTANLETVDDLIKNELGLFDAPEVQLPVSEYSQVGLAVEPELSETPEQTEAPAIEAIDYEADFINGAKYINRSHDFGLFETKLLRIGWYENPDEGIDSIQFRIDIWVKHVGDASEEFLVSNAFVRKISNNTFKSTSWNFSEFNITAGEERTGYVLFEDVPYDWTGEVDISIGTSQAYSSIFGFTMHSPHLYQNVIIH